MRIEKLNKVLAAHKLWLTGNGGKRANLSGANLSEADLSWAKLSEADLSGAKLSGAKLSWAKLSWANLSEANLLEADLSWANLSEADLSGANLSGANLSGAEGLISTVNFLEANFEHTPDGYIAYKAFNSVYAPPVAWEIEAGAIIEENVNFNRCDSCGCGINVAPLEWVKKHYKGDIWKVLIRWEWLCGVCVPYMSNGKIRCERVELVEVVE